MLNQAQIDLFREKGFLLGSHALTDEQVDELRSELARVIDDYEKRGYSTTCPHCQPRWQR